MRAGNRGADFEKHGLSRGRETASGHVPLLTVDLEAFHVDGIPMWMDAMHHWAGRTQASALHFCIFVVVEDVVKLGTDSRGECARLLGGMRFQKDAGLFFYAQNRYAFDPRTRERRTPAREPEGLPPGYTKRQSMLFDVIYRHRLDLDTWLGTV
jgi:hypothetical protein